MLTPVLLELCVLLTASNPYLSEARQLYGDLRYDRAIPKLELARRVKSSTPQERQEILDLLARAHLALGNEGQARDAYAELLSRDAHAKSPDDAAPKVRALFQQTKEKIYPPDFVRLKQASAPEGEVAFEVIDPWNRVAKVMLLELGDDDNVTAVELRYRDHRAEGAPRSRADRARYHVEAWGPGAEVRARMGSREAPFGPSREGRGEPGARVAAWTLGGVAVATGIAGVLFAVASTRDAAAAGRAPFASQTAALDGRAHDRAVAANVLVGASVVAGAATAVVCWQF